MSVLTPYKAQVKELWLNGRLLPTSPDVPWDITHLLKCGTNELRIVYYGDYEWTDFVVTPLLPVDFSFFAFNYTAKFAGICWKPLGAEDWLHWPYSGSRSVLRHDDVSMSLYSITSNIFECKPPTDVLSGSMPFVGVTPPNPVYNQEWRLEFSKALGATSYAASLYLINPNQFPEGTTLVKSLGSGAVSDITALTFSLPVDSNLEWLVVVGFDNGISTSASIINNGAFFADNNFTPLVGSVGAGVSCMNNEPSSLTTAGECIKVVKLGNPDLALFADCDECTSNRFKLQWDVFSEGMVGGDPWVITNNGHKVRFVIEDSANCGGINSQTQSGYALATIHVGANDVEMGLDFEGITEYENTGYENIQFKLDGPSFNNVELARATSAEQGLGCTFFGPLLEENKIYSVAPPYLLLSGNTYTFRIDFTTFDAQFHTGCYYQVNLTFNTLGSGSGGGTISVPSIIPEVTFSTVGTSFTDALTLFVIGGEAEGEYQAELAEDGSRTGVWAKVGSDQFGIVASGHSSEVLDYTAAPGLEVLYSLVNLSNTASNAANLGAYSKVSGSEDYVTVLNARP